MDVIALEPPIEVDLDGNPGLVHFETVEQAETWANKEQKAWETLIAAANRSGQQWLVANQSQALQQLSNATQILRKSNGKNTSELESIFRIYKKRNVIHSSTAIGNAAISLANINIPEASALVASETNVNSKFYLTFVNGNQVQASLLPIFRGVSEAMFYRKGINSGVEEERALFVEARTEATKHNIEATNSLTEFHNNSKSALNNFEELRETRNREFLATLRTADEGFTNKVQEHQTTLLKIEGDFAERMRLQAPRRYWAAKRARHRIAASCWGVVLLLACAASLFAIIRWAPALIGYLPKDREIWAIDWAVIGVPVLLALSIIRILHRQTTQNIALSNDADERVTMVETYLALFNEQKIQEIERPLILQPLFRPSTITGDDGLQRSILDHILDIVNKDKS